MSWFFIALITPILFAVVVHLDKFLIHSFSKSNESQNVGSLILYSSLFGFIASFFIFLFIGFEILDITRYDFLLLFITGFIGTLAIIFYLYAMEKDEASIVAPLFQIVPILGLILEFFILGIKPNNIQILGSMIIIIFGIILVTKFEEAKKVNINIKIFMLMFLSSLCFSLIAILFKMATFQNQNFWVSSFWEYFTWGLIGLLIFIFVKKYRIAFMKSIQKDGHKIFSINIFNEIINIVANSAKNFAALLVPVALVYGVESLQPVFVFIFGILITLLFPKLPKEDLSKKSLTRKSVAIIGMILGTILILR